MLSGAYPQYRVRYYRGEYDKNRTLYRTQAEALEKGGGPMSQATAAKQQPLSPLSHELL